MPLPTRWNCDCRRQDKYAAQPLHPPVAAAETEGPRAISRAVEKNRGLTPHRRKDIKNPRVKVPLCDLYCCPYMVVAELQVAAMLFSIGLTRCPLLISWCYVAGQEEV